jgi:hypothetical protein
MQHAFKKVLIQSRAFNVSKTFIDRVWWDERRHVMMCFWRPSTHTAPLLSTWPTITRKPSPHTATDNSLQAFITQKAPTHSPDQFNAQAFIAHHTLRPTIACRPSSRKKHPLIHITHNQFNAQAFIAHCTAHQQAAIDAGSSSPTSWHTHTGFTDKPSVKTCDCLGWHTHTGFTDKPSVKTCNC